MNEKDIIKRCQRGEKSAFDELIRTYYPYVTKYLLKLTQNELLTEDLTQEVFLKIIRTIENYDINGNASFATYIITAAKNKYIDYLRKNKVLFSDISEVEIQSDENVENKVISGMQFDEILEHINSLPPNQRLVIQMKYIDDYTLKEIEAITGVPAKTVKSRIHEGAKKLRHILSGSK